MSAKVENIVWFFFVFVFVFFWQGGGGGGGIQFRFQDIIIYQQSKHGVQQTSGIICATSLRLILKADAESSKAVDSRFVHGPHATFCVPSLGKVPGMRKVTSGLAFFRLSLPCVMLVQEDCLFFAWLPNGRVPFCLFVCLSLCFNMHLLLIRLITLGWSRSTALSVLSKIKDPHWWLRGWLVA